MILSPLRLKEKLQLAQILRGLAALSVLLLHAHRNNIEYIKIRPLFSDFYEYGWLGVYFFFVLSGFIITYVHFKDLETGGSVRSFVYKRFVRVYPLYWIIATVMLLYYVFLKKDEIGTTVTVKSLSDFLYLVKCYILLPTLPYKNNFIFVAWSLSFEVLFYLIFAFCIKLGLQKSIYLYLGWLLLIILKYYTEVGNSSKFLNFVFNPVILYFLAGCLIAYLIKKRNITITTAYFITGAVIIWTIFFLYLHFSTDILSEYKFNINYNYFIIAFFLILLWWAASLDVKKKTRKPFSNILLLVGDASYSLYLIHPTILMLFYKGTGLLFSKYHITASILAGNLIFIFAVACCVFSGILVHLNIEKPLLGYLNKRISYMNSIHPTSQ